MFTTPPQRIKVGLAVMSIVPHDDQAEIVLGFLTEYLHPFSTIRQLNGGVIVLPENTVYPFDNDQLQDIGVTLDPSTLELMTAGMKD